MKKHICIFSLFILLLSSSVYANPPFSKGPDGMSSLPPMMRLLENADILEEELELSDKQISAIEKINLKHEKTHLTYAETLILSQLKVKRLTLENPINYKKIRNILESTSEIMINMRIGSIQHMEEIKAQLNSRQRLKLKRLNKKRRFGNMQSIYKGRKERQ